MIGRVAIDLLLAQPKTEKTMHFLPADVGEGHFIVAVMVVQRICILADLHD